MVVNSQYLKHIASLLKVKIEKINLSEGRLCACIVNGKKVSGVINVINSLLEVSRSNLSGFDLSEKSEIQQWVEYVLVYTNDIHTNTNHLNLVLNELNAVLSTRTYLVSYRLTLADVLLYYILSNVMASLTTSEKEKYINVSRWFDNLQQEKLLQQAVVKANTVNFNTNYLVSLAPLRH